MAATKHNPENIYPPYSNYCHAVEISGNSKLLIISGLNGYLSDGNTMPDSFEDQAEIIWKHLGTILRSADMDYHDLVSLRFYLASPEYDEANVRLRAKYLGDHKTALTVICCKLLDPKWKVEIEAMASREEL